jgi:hypothetical protein
MKLEDLAREIIESIAARQDSVEVSWLKSELKTSSAAISRAIREHGPELADLVGVHRIKYVPGRYKPATPKASAWYSEAFIEWD